MQRTDMVPCLSDGQQQSELGSMIKLPTCGGILSLNSLELLMEERSEMDMSGNSSHGVLS